MATIQETVRPGDVISSSLLNRMIALLNEHEARLAGGTGGATGPLLTGFSPPSEQNVNKMLTVFGNFDFPLATNALSIDGVPVSPATFLPGSNNLQLIFIIPPTLAVPAGQTKTVTVRVVNARGQDQQSYRLLPEVTGAPPNPVIVRVEDSETGHINDVQSGVEARIVGRNFAAPAAGNTVQLILNSGSAEQTFTLPLKAGSTVQPAPQESTLLVDMPAITGGTVGTKRPCAVRVTAVGANSPAELGLTILRTA